MVRQVIVENLMLAGVAGALGWWIANWSVRTWAVVTASVYQVLDYTVDSGTLAYLVAIAVAAAGLCSLAPIGRVVQLGVNGALQGDARGVTQGRRGKRLAAALVAGQMALAMVLLSGAGILVRSFVNIVGAETGVRDPEHILVGAMRLPSDKYPRPETRRGYFDRVEARLKTIPAIEEESVSSTIPVKFAGVRTFEIQGRSSPPEGEESVAFLRVGADYFRVVGASAISGRDFTDGDHAAALPVAIVNQRFVARVGRSLAVRLRDDGRRAQWS
jgi:putative ABC transport system permease protein